MIARPPVQSQQAPVRSAPTPTTTQSQRPATQTVSATPGQSAARVETRPVPVTRPAAPTPQQRPASPSREALPSPRQRNVPLYSVQRMGSFPGDYDATAGFPEGLPENARVEPIPRSADEGDEDDTSSDDEDESWPEEYPDPLGGPIGRQPLNGGDEDD